MQSIHIYYIRRYSHITYTVILKVILRTHYDKVSQHLYVIGTFWHMPIASVQKNSHHSEFKDEKMKSWWSLRVSILTQRTVTLPGVLNTPFISYIHVNSYDKTDTSVPFMFKFNTWDLIYTGERITISKDIIDVFLIYLVLYMIIFKNIIVYKNFATINMHNLCRICYINVNVNIFVL